MMNDTVREELRTKTAPNLDSGRIAMPTIARPPAVRAPAERTVPIQRIIQKPVHVQAVPNPVLQRPLTSDLTVKKTSQTLVGFQSKNAALPDWRLQLQNSIRQRTSGTPQSDASNTEAVSGNNKQPATSGANALKIETAPEPAPAAHVNPRVVNALKRIEESRRAFLEESEPSPMAEGAKPNIAAPRTFPFNVVSRSPQPDGQGEHAAPMIAPKAKPRLVSSLRIEKRGLDTNKLPPIQQPAALSTSLDYEPAAADSTDEETFTGDPHRTKIKIEAFRDETVETAHSPEIEEPEEIDDLAPFSMRFGAGVFDVIIGVFATAILLSPLMLSGGSWLSFSGVLAFGAALAIVLFVYLTATIGIYGRTFGMRLFSLEMIDADENAYPTLHQAAVSSAVYILSIALGGIGFLPVLFNDEKRAAHDILSGTILIREV